VIGEVAVDRIRRVIEAIAPNGLLKAGLDIEALADIFPDGVRR
jgi:hypothetical protein